MTINGPAPMVLAFFLNAAIDQRCEKHILEHGLEADGRERLKASTDDRGLRARLPGRACPRATTASA